MSPFLILTCLVLLFRQSQTHRPIALEPRIVRGVKTQQSKYPYIAAIRSVETDSNGNLYMSEAWCGGSLLRKSYPAAILTAAHCVFDSSVPLIVELNTSSTQTQTPTLGVTAWRVISYVVHEQFDEVLLDNDIAVLFIHADLTSRTDLYLSTVTIPNLENPTRECCNNGGVLQIIGYGRTALGAAYSNTLEYSNLAFVDRSSCNAQFCLWETQNRNCQYTYATDTNICAAGQSTSPCHGDSGGPLVQIGTNIQVGIVSWGVNCLTTLPTIFTNTGVFNTWISSKLSGFTPTIRGLAISHNLIPTTIPLTTHKTTPAPTVNANADNYPSATNEPIDFETVNPTSNPDPRINPSYLTTNVPSVSSLYHTTSTVNPAGSAASTVNPTTTESTLSPTTYLHASTSTTAGNIYHSTSDLQASNDQTAASPVPVPSISASDDTDTHINSTSVPLDIYDNTGTVNNLVVVNDETRTFLIIGCIAIASLFVVIMLLFLKYKCCIINGSKNKKQNKISYNKVKTTSNVEHDGIDGLEFATTIPINVDGAEHLNIDVIVEAESGADSDSSITDNIFTK